MILFFIGYWICHCFSIIFTGKTDNCFLLPFKVFGYPWQIKYLLQSCFNFLLCYMVSLFFFQLAAKNLRYSLFLDDLSSQYNNLKLCIMPSIIIIVIMISKNTLLMVQRKWKNMLACIKDAVTIWKICYCIFFFLSSKVHLLVNIALFLTQWMGRKIKVFLNMFIIILPKLDNIACKDV